MWYCNSCRVFTWPSQRDSRPRIKNQGTSADCRNPTPGGSRTRGEAYAFPSFGLLPKSLAKVRRKQATIVVVSPYLPSAPWFPLLLELAVDVTRALRPSKNLLTSPEGLAHPLPLLLIAWRLCGDAGETKAFRKRWSSFCWKERVTPHGLPSNPSGAIGSIGATNGIWIPFQLL